MHKNVHPSLHLMRETIWPKNFSSVSKAKIFLQIKVTFIRRARICLRERKWNDLKWTKVHITKIEAFQTTTPKNKIQKTESRHSDSRFEATFTGCKFCPSHKASVNKIFPELPSESHRWNRTGREHGHPNQALQEVWNKSSRKWNTCFPAVWFLAPTRETTL